MSTPRTDVTASRQTSEIFGRPPIESIAARAYQRYLERGGLDGHDLDDWLQAEREISDGAPARAGSYQEQDDDAQQEG